MTSRPSITTLTYSNRYNYYTNNINHDLMIITKRLDDSFGLVQPSLLVVDQLVCIARVTAVSHWYCINSHKFRTNTASACSSTVVITVVDSRSTRPTQRC